MIISHSKASSTNPILTFTIFSRNMRIACLQFNPELGRLPENITLANTLLEAASPQNLDLLVLPELAFTGNASSYLPCRFPSRNSVPLNTG